MDLISMIRSKYKGDVLLHKPYCGRRSDSVPEELYAILCACNGISETITLPGTAEKVTIGWIVYPYEMIMESTAFYAANYGIGGVVFSDDGAGNPFILNPDGSVSCYHPIANEETPQADSLSDFFL